jgi:uncharacterized protein (DUF1684 family)
MSAYSQYKTVSLLACVGQSMTFDENAWREELLENRTEKDRFFTEHPQSPISPDERDDFDGLAYFDPDPSFRVEATVEPNDDSEPVVMETTADTEVRYERVADLSFAVNETEQTLSAYQQNDQDQWFIPLRDKTTGQQTYHEGRYMELEVGEVDEIPDTLTLDFNLTYSPFCAYSDTFACPLPPEENWLDVTIKAGERTLE